MVAVDPKFAARLDDMLTQDLQRDGRLGKPRRYLAGDHDKPYMPTKASQEFKALAEKSVTNWTSLVSDTYSKGLFVDGFRPARSADNSPAWDIWQANGLDSRQTIAHRGALEYGTSYALILPGSVGTKRIPYFRPQSPLTTLAWYQDDDDEFPEVGLRRIGTSVDGTRLIQVLDNQYIRTFALPENGSNWILSKTEEHGLGVTPLVRFRDRLDGPAVGIIAPIIPLQDRINEISFSTMIALQYASWRQRWATGMAIPEDDEGNPVEPFESAVNRLWIAEDDTVKFGDFAQTETSGHQQAYTSAVSTLAAVSQINPTILTGSFDNISADALAALQDTTQRKIGEYETIFGESWESAFRLAAKASGDTAGAADTASEVRWRDSEARSMAATVDALGKMAQMLDVPAEALWEMIPGVTDGDIERWKALRASDPIASLASAIQGSGSVASNTLNAAVNPDQNANQ